MRIKVLLVDDHVLVRQALRALLEAYDQIEVVGEASDGATALRLADELSPDVVVVDLRLPDISGFDVARQLNGQPKGGKVLLLSADGDSSTAAKARLAGASGFLRKDRAFEELVPAIEVAYAVAGVAPG